MELPRPVLDPPRAPARLPLLADLRPRLTLDVFLALLRPPLDAPRPALEPPRAVLLEDFRPPRALDVFFAALLRPPLDEPRPLLDPPRPPLLEDFRPPLALDVFFAVLLRPPLEEPRPLLEPVPPPLLEDLRARPEPDDDFVAPELRPPLDEVLRLRLPLDPVDPRLCSELRLSRSSLSVSVSRVPSVFCRESVSLLLVLVSSWSGLSARSMSLGFRCICSLLSESSASVLVATQQADRSAARNADAPRSP